MSQTVLKAEGVSKKYCRSLKRSLFYGILDIAKNVLPVSQNRSLLRKDEFWALKDINFELKKGQCLGLVGHNGAGKSTLLKVLNGLIRLDEGRVEIDGRLGGLIELGAGFSPVLTGRENILINGAVLGMSKKELARRYDEIVDFAELGDFIDAPLRSYSSGMKVRLGFAVAATLEPDILIIDEVLAVGDSSFKQRCLDRLDRYRKKGGTIILVSHNSTVIESICDTSILLEKGVQVRAGETSAILREYESKALQVSMEALKRLERLNQPEKRSQVAIESVAILDKKKKVSSQIHYQEPFTVRLHYRCEGEVTHPYFSIRLHKDTPRSTPFSTLNMMWDGVNLPTLPKEGEIACEVHTPQLSPGLYHISVYVQKEVSGKLGQKHYAPLQYATSFTISSEKMKSTQPHLPAGHLVSKLPPLVLDHSWEIDGESLEKPKIRKIAS